MKITESSKENVTMGLKLRNLFFLFFTIIAFVIFHTPLRELAALSLSYEDVYSHIFLIPLISGYFLFSERKNIFSNVEYYISGGFIILTGIILYKSGISYSDNLSNNDYLSVMILSVVITWIGGFFLFYGGQAFVKAWFPLVFIVLMIPIPSMILNNIIFILQKLSMETANVLFMISGVPFYNEGFTFHLSDLSVEVAEQCSGIRSSLALFIGSLLAGHLFLKTTWRKIILTLVVFPICIMRNGVRIVILSLLGNYVNPGILSGDLHRKGGIPLFIISFAFLMILCWLMRKSEKKRFFRGDQI